MVNFSAANNDDVRCYSLIPKKGGKELGGVSEMESEIH